MSQETLDLRRSLQIVRRHRTAVGVAAALGLLAGAAFTVLSPPMLSSTALVVLPPSFQSATAAPTAGTGTTNDGTATQVVIASSSPVLSGALPRVKPAMSLQSLQSDVQVSSPTPGIISISSQGKTAAQAEGTANAVADSYVAYVSSPRSVAGKVQARLLEPATSAAGTPLSRDLLITGVLGALLGALLGAIGAVAFGRGDRRLRERDEIADAIGVPVLASIPVDHPADAGRWTRLLEDYEPSVVHAWQLRNALRYLGQADVISAHASNGHSSSVAVVSLSSDRGALALGPQLAVFAASLGIPTALVIGPQQDANVTAALHAACAAPLPSPRRSGQLQVAVADRDDMAQRQPDARLTVIVTVVDGQSPRVADTMRPGATVLGVSAGEATAAQLARVAVSAAAAGRQIDGILIADPDPADHTTGRVPQLARPAQRRMPTRLTGMTTGTRR
jgi:capsular polysaccharide biosynthesis protein